MMQKNVAYVSATAPYRIMNKTMPRHRRKGSQDMKVWLPPSLHPTKASKKPTMGHQSTSLPPQHASLFPSSRIKSGPVQHLYILPPKDSSFKYMYLWRSLNQIRNSNLQHYKYESVAKLSEF